MYFRGLTLLVRTLAPLARYKVYVAGLSLRSRYDRVHFSFACTWGCGRAKNADALDVKPWHPTRDRSFGAVFRELGRGAGKLGAGKERRPTLRGQLRGLS